MMHVLFCVAALLSCRLLITVTMHVLFCGAALLIVRTIQLCSWLC